MCPSEPLTETDEDVYIILIAHMCSSSAVWLTSMRDVCAGAQDPTSVSLTLVESLALALVFSSKAGEKLHLSHCVPPLVLELGLKAELLLDGPSHPQFNANGAETQRRKTPEDGSRSPHVKDDAHRVLVASVTMLSPWKPPRDSRMKVSWQDSTNLEHTHGSFSVTAQLIRGQEVIDFALL